MANSTATVDIDPRHVAAAGAGWVQCVTTTERKRMLISTQARDKSGKTHFGFTMPGPIAFLNMDKGHEGVIEKFLRTGKIIVRKDFVINPLKRMTEAQWDALWYELRASYVYAVTSGHFRSVFVDTGTAMWEAQRMEAFGKLAQVPPLKYTETNAAFEALLSIALDYPVNVVISHRMKAEYTNDAAGKGSKTGAWTPTGYKDIRYVVQTNVEQAWDEAANVPLLRIDNCRPNMALRGMVLSGDMVNFSTLGMMIHGVESAADWDDGCKPVLLAGAGGAGGAGGAR